MSFSNNLKTDFYRLKFSKWIWIMPIVFFVLMLILYALYYILYSAYQSGVAPETDGIDSELLFMSGNIGKIMLFEAPNQSDLYIALLVGSSLFICQEFNSGMTKIRVSRGNNRTHMFFSKFIVLSFVTIIYTAFPKFQTKKEPKGSFFNTLK